MESEGSRVTEKNRPNHKWNIADILFIISTRNSELDSRLSRLETETGEDG